jgi:cobalt/nickel transport system permease protein
VGNNPGQFYSPDGIHYRPQYDCLLIADQKNKRIQVFPIKDIWGEWISFIIMALVLILSRVPVGYVLTRSLIILPFVLLTAVFLPFLSGDRPAGGTSLGIGTVTLTSSGLQVFWYILLMGFIGVFASILLSSE